MAAPEPDPIETPKRSIARRERREDDEKRVDFRGHRRSGYGLALLIVPSLVGQLLLGEELTGVAIPVARVAGMALVALGIACWPGTPLIGMLTYSAAVHALSCLPRFRRWVGRRPFLAGGCPSRDPDCAPHA